MDWDKERQDKKKEGGEKVSEVDKVCNVKRGPEKKGKKSGKVPSKGKANNKRMNNVQLTMKNVQKKNQTVGGTRNASVLRRLLREKAL